MRVAILGCGPAGLFAATAARDLGHTVQVFSNPRKSLMNGAQYLHQPIPGLSTDPFEINYILDGPIDGYRRKVYGGDSEVDVSPESLVGRHQAWDIREAYDAAWFEFGREVLAVDFRTEGSISALIRSHNPDMVISTIPAPILCFKPEHKFKSAQVWAIDSVKPVGPFEVKSGMPLADNVVVCSGFDDDWWYRASRIQGYENTEFPDHRQPATARKWHVDKPIETDCNCHPGINRLGRYGAWTKGVLSHEAYTGTLELLK